MIHNFKMDSATTIVRVVKEDYFLRNITVTAAVKAVKTLKSLFRKGTGDLTYAQKVEMFQARAQAIRDTLPNKYKNYGNVAVADVIIPGLKTEFKAYSRIHKENADGFSSVTGEGAFPRDNDTERKILEDIAYQLGNSKQAKGTLDLFTELPACGSCSDIIMKFRQEYPNIKLNVYSGEFKN